MVKGLLVVLSWLRLHARPGDREPEGIASEAFSQIDILRVAIPEIGGIPAGGIRVLHPLPDISDIHVPQVVSFALVVGGSYAEDKRLRDRRKLFLASKTG